MLDPLAEVVTLLQPSARFSKLVNGAGAPGVYAARKPGSPSTA
jgi:hypothetical protein